MPSVDSPFLNPWRGSLKSMGMRCRWVHMPGIGLGSSGAASPLFHRNRSPNPLVREFLSVVVQHHASARWYALALSVATTDQTFMRTERGATPKHCRAEHEIQDASKMQASAGRETEQTCLDENLNTENRSCHRLQTCKPQLLPLPSQKAEPRPSSHPRWRT